MNLFHTLRQKAEFADIVFILMARSLCLTTQRNLTILQIERRCVCKRLAPYQISQEKMTARLGTLRRSFFLAFFIACGDFPCNLKRYEDGSADQRQQHCNIRKTHGSHPLSARKHPGSGNFSRKMPYPAFGPVRSSRLRCGHSAFAVISGSEFSIP